MKGSLHVKCVQLAAVIQNISLNTYNTLPYHFQFGRYCTDYCVLLYLYRSLSLFVPHSVRACFIRSPLICDIICICVQLNFHNCSPAAIRAMLSPPLRAPPTGLRFFLVTISCDTLDSHRHRPWAPNHRTHTDCIQSREWSPPIPCTLTIQFCASFSNQNIFYRPPEVAAFNSRTYNCERLTGWALLLLCVSFVLFRSPFASTIFDVDRRPKCKHRSDAVFSARVQQMNRFWGPTLGPLPISFSPFHKEVSHCQQQ